MTEEKTKEIKDGILVVNELPSQQVNQAVTDDGKKLNLITIDQALTEMYQDIKAIKKAVA